MSQDLIEHFKLEAHVHNDYVVHVVYVSDLKRGIRKKRTEVKWHIKEHLGSGAFGEVYLQVQRTDGQDGAKRAVKTIQKKRMKRSGIDYRRELLALAKLSRFPELFVALEGWYENEISVFLAMEYYPLGDLDEYINNGIPEADAKVITAQLTEGLMKMHTIGFTHRDLKPQNVFVVAASPEWWVKIGDFGISKRVSTEETALRTQAGTQLYQAPEIFDFTDIGDNGSEYTSAVDMWSLGCVVYVMLVRDFPFPTLRAVSRYCSGKFPFPAQALSTVEVSDEGIDFVKSLLNPQPSKRATAESAARDIWLRGETPIIQEPDAEESTSTPSGTDLDNGLTPVISPMSPNPPATHANDLESALNHIEKSAADGELLKIMERSPTQASVRTDRSSGNNSEHEDTGNSQDLSSVSEIKPVGWATPDTSVNASHYGNEEPQPDKESHEEEVIHNAPSSTIRNLVENDPIPQIIASSSELDAFAESEDNSIGSDEKLKEDDAVVEEARSDESELPRPLIERPLPIIERSRPRVEESVVEEPRPIHETPRAEREMLHEPLVEDPPIGNTAVEEVAINQPILHEDIRLPFSVWDEGLIYAGVEKKAVDLGPPEEAGSLFLLAARMGWVNQLEAFLQEGFNIDFADNQGRTALHMATSRNKIATITWLSEQKADLNLADLEGRTALHDATDWYSLDTASHLLKLGCNVNPRTKNSLTPLHIACTHGKSEFVTLLLEYNAHVNTEDSDCNTPLHAAAQSGNASILRELVDAGADVLSENRAGENAMLELRRQGRLQLVQFLEDAAEDQSAPYFLPAGWEKRRTETGGEYYINTQGSEVSLEKPGKESRYMTTILRSRGFKIVSKVDNLWLEDQAGNYTNLRTLVYRKGETFGTQLAVVLKKNPRDAVSIMQGQKSLQTVIHESVSFVHLEARKLFSIKGLWCSTFTNRNTFRGPNPYAIIRCNDRSYTTSYFSNMTSPFWSLDVDLFLGPKDVITIELYDERRFSKSDSGFSGYGDIVVAGHVDLETMNTQSIEVLIQGLGAREMKNFPYMIVDMVQPLLEASATVHDN